MYHVAKMYTDLQWSFDTLEEVHAFLWRDEVYHNDAIVVEVTDDGIRAWIGTDFFERYDELFEAA